MFAIESFLHYMVNKFFTTKSIIKRLTRSTTGTTSGQTDTTNGQTSATSGERSTTSDQTSIASTTSDKMGFAIIINLNQCPFRCKSLK